MYFYLFTLNLRSHKIEMQTVGVTESKIGLVLSYKYKKGQKKIIQLKFTIILK